MHTTPNQLEPETLHVEDRWAKALRSLLSPQMLLPLVAGVLLYIVLASLVLGLFGVPDESRRGIALVLTIVIMVGFVALKVWLHAATLAKTTLTLDPSGMTMVEGSVTRRLAWNDMTAIGPVVPLRGVEVRGGGSSARTGQGLAAGVNRVAQALSGDLGILGRGTIQADPHDPLAARILEQNAGIWGEDAAGVPLVGISPVFVEKDWVSGRVGEWLRHFRPDLLAAHSAR